jgi:hypothetical protein
MKRKAALNNESIPWKKQSLCRRQVMKFEELMKGYGEKSLDRRRGIPRRN